MNKERPPRRGRRYPRGRRLSDVSKTKPKRPKRANSSVRKPKTNNNNDLGDLSRYKHPDQSPEKIYGGGRGGSRVNPWSQRGKEDNQEDLQNNPFAQNALNKEADHDQGEPDFGQSMNQNEDYGLPDMNNYMPDYGKDGYNQGGQNPNNQPDQNNRNSPQNLNYGQNGRPSSNNHSPSSSDQASDG